MYSDTTTSSLLRRDVVLPTSRPEQQPWGDCSGVEALTRLEEYLEPPHGTLEVTGGPVHRGGHRRGGRSS